MSAPPVPLDRVEWRVDSQPFYRGQEAVCRWVPYLNAAIVASLLDDWVGADGWSDRYEPGTLAGRDVLWCHLTVGEVTKSDVGVPSHTEPQKGMVSDAFKRAACLKWGVGRNVYDLPTLWAPCDVTERGQKKYARENARTLPSLLDQLKAKGFDAGSARVRDDVDPATGEITEPSDGGEAQQAPARPDVQVAPSAGDDLDGLTVRELNERLDAAGLAKGGTKAAMIERLREHREAA